MQHTSKLSITLPVDMVQLIHESVDKELYASDSEFIQEAVQNWMMQENNRKVKLEKLRQDILDGLESGESSTWNPDEIKTQARQQRATQANKTIN